MNQWPGRVSWLEGSQLQQHSQYSFTSHPAFSREATGNVLWGKVICWLLVPGGTEWSNCTCPEMWRKYLHTPFGNLLEGSKAKAVNHSEMLWAPSSVSGYFELRQGFNHSIYFSQPTSRFLMAHCLEINYSNKQSPVQDVPEYVWVYPSIHWFGIHRFSYSRILGHLLKR